MNAETAPAPLTPVQRAMVEQDFSHARLAEKAGVAEPTVAKAARGEPITLRKAFRIARVLGFSGREHELFPDLFPEPQEASA